MGDASTEQVEGSGGSPGVLGSEDPGAKGDPSFPYFLHFGGRPTAFGTD